MSTAIQLSSSASTATHAAPQSASLSGSAVASGSGSGQDEAMGQTTQSSELRSTRGASKQRRDQINAEIQRLRDLLPLSESIKDRLFQLQIMSLGCIFIRKHRYQQHVIRHLSESPFPTPKGIDICKAMRGFMLLMTRSGKMLHVSENASEYLGHSVEEIMCQGDSIYDLVDSRDHSAVQAELASGPPLAETFPEERVFICRLNLARTAKRQLQYHKFILLQGRYIHSSEYYQSLANTPESTQPIFATYCQPLVNPENAEGLSSGNTSVFTSQHFLDMKFKEVDPMCAYHLGYSVESLEGTSWYQLLHPSHVPEIAYKHRLLCQEKEGSVLALIRMQTATGSWIWLHTVFAVRGNFSHELQEGRRVRHLIHCYYQILSDLEAATLQANAWIYSMRHTYPAAFPCQDSPCSDQDRAMSPASPSPFPIEGFQSACEQFGFIKQENVFGQVPILPQQQAFPMSCDQFQIKVEIPHKQMVNHLSLFTPESSSPESSASLHSALFSQPSFLSGSSLEPASLLEEILPGSGKTLPDLRDDLDDFFRQVEQPAPAPQPCLAQFPFSNAVAPSSCLVSARHSPPQANELFKYLGPALFAGTNTVPHPQEVQYMAGHRYSVPDCADYSTNLDPFFTRKRSWAV